MGEKSSTSLWIFIGLVAGVVVGQLLYDPTWDSSAPQSAHSAAKYLALFEFVGFTVFMALLKMLIIPLIASSVFISVTGVGDFTKLGRLGSWTLVYYFLTMFLAVSLGLVVVNVISPGANINAVFDSAAEVASESIAQSAEGGVLGVFSNLVSLMFPSNIIEAMAEGQTLSVIVFFLFLGVVATQLGESAKPLVAFFESLTKVMMRMVEIVLYLAPLGVFCLLAWTVARIGLGVFGGSIGLYMLTVVVGLLIHAVILLPTILAIVGKANPLKFFSQMRSALLMAFSTASSSATLPVTMECAEDAGVSRRASGLVLPLGATINMDGTALYEAVAVVFMAQACGIDLSLAQMAIIAVTATLAAIGAAGIPSAGLVTMFIVLDAVNGSLLAADPQNATIPLHAVGLIIGVDRILDMLRTSVNVWGDSIGAKLISALDRS